MFSGGEREGLALWFISALSKSMVQWASSITVFSFCMIGEEWHSAGEGVLWEETVWSCNRRPGIQSREHIFRLVPAVRTGWEYP
ncbi:MAG: hypothetical protein ACLU4N_24650 [Butyricimonas faecihominis]